MAFIGSGTITGGFFDTCTLWTARATTNCTAVITMIVARIASTWRDVTGWMTERIASVAAAMPQLRDGWLDPFQPSVMLVKARAFIERIAHRELRRFTAGWRACPSI